MSLKTKIKKLLSDRVLAGFLLLTLFTLLYHWYFNRFAPITEGWFNTYAAAMQNGKVPYKDFYFFITPLYLYIYLGIMTLFGGAFIVQRIYGIGERIAINGLMYFTLARFFKPATAVFACIVGFCIYANHNIDIIYSYYQTSFLVSLTAIALLAHFNPADINRRQLLLLVAAGVAAATAFLIKQTMGVFIIAVILSYLFLILLKQNPKKIPLCFAAVLAPVAVLTAAQIFYIYSTGALAPFIEQVFKRGFTSKGSVFSILTNFYKQSFNVAEVLIFASLLAGGYLLKKFKNKPAPPLASVKDKIYVLIAATLFAVITAILLKVGIVPVKRFIIQSIFYLSFFGGFYYAALALRRKLSAREGFYLLMCGTSFGIMYAQGLSSVVDEWGSLVGGAFFTALFIDSETWANKIKNIFLVTFLSVFVLSMMHLRYSEPYEWWGDKEDAAITANTQVNIPAYKGLKMSQLSAQRYEGLISLIRQNIKTPQDKIYISQNISGLYYASGTLPFTFAYTDYFDVCNDDCARTNAAQIKEAMPKMIVFMDFPEYTWELHERLFRNSKPSGQREIKRVVEEISPYYNLVKVYNENKSQLDDFIIYVWVKK